MRRILPSLMALQCFEAAARHLSFTYAAQELHLTQSAVSRQVRAMEDLIGQPLFERIKQRLVLTVAGKAYAASVSDVLDRAEAATLVLMKCTAKKTVLNIAIPPTFGSRWLVPKLGSFTTRHPDIQVNLVTHVRQFDFSKSDMDVAINFGPALWPGAICHPLIGEVVVPMCSPRLLGAKKRLVDPREIFDYPMLQHASRPQAWTEWLRAVGVSEFGELTGPRLEHFFMLIQAAVAGLGIAVLPEFLMLEELQDGRLVRAIEKPVRSPFKYYLAYPVTKSDNRTVQVFREWLLEIAQAETDVPAVPGRDVAVPKTTEAALRPRRTRGASLLHTPAR